MRIKNWEKFQHYKQRKPIWIKLYRDLLDDIEFHRLSGDEVKILIMCWLIASEDEEMLGQLPSVQELAFRLRVDEKYLGEKLKNLGHWIEGNRDASKLLEQRKQEKQKPATANNKEAHELCALMRDEMLAEKPDSVVSITKKWVDDMDKLIRIDGRTQAQIHRVIQWACHDTGNGTWTGWAANVRSPAKLRQQFDKLEIAMNRGVKPVAKNLTNQEAAYQRAMDVLKGE